MWYLMGCAYSWNTKVSSTDSDKTPVNNFFLVEFNTVNRKKPTSYTVVPG